MIATYIYYDERKDKLAKIEEKAKRELGMLPEETYDPGGSRKFIENTKHLKRYKANGDRAYQYRGVDTYCVADFRHALAFEEQHSIGSIQYEGKGFIAISSQSDCCRRGDQPPRIGS